MLAFLFIVKNGALEHTLSSCTGVAILQTVVEWAIELGKRRNWINYIPVGSRNQPNRQLKPNNESSTIYSSFRALLIYAYNSYHTWSCDKQNYIKIFSLRFKCTCLIWVPTFTKVPRRCKMRVLFFFLNLFTEPSCNINLSITLSDDRFL